MAERDLRDELSLLREELVDQGDEHEKHLAQLAAIHEELAGIRQSLGTMWAYLVTGKWEPPEPSK